MRLFDPSPSPRVATEERNEPCSRRTETAEALLLHRSGNTKQARSISTAALALDTQEPPANFLLQNVQFFSIFLQPPKPLPIPGSKPSSLRRNQKEQQWQQRGLFSSKQPVRVVALEKSRQAPFFPPGRKYYSRNGKYYQRRQQQLQLPIGRHAAMLLPLRLLQFSLQDKNLATCGVTDTPDMGFEK